jgi:hypothetical protein
MPAGAGDLNAKTQNRLALQWFSKTLSGFSGKSQIILDLDLKII